MCCWFLRQEVGKWPHSSGNGERYSWKPFFGKQDTNATILFNAGPNLLTICRVYKELRRNTTGVIKENINATGTTCVNLSITVAYDLQDIPVLRIENCCQFPLADFANFFTNLGIMKGKELTVLPEVLISLRKEEVKFTFLQRTIWWSNRKKTLCWLRPQG